MTSACQWIFGGRPLPDVLALIARSYDRIEVAGEPERGQRRLEPLFAIAARIAFDGPFVMTFAAPGPNPFEADKGPQAMRDLDGGLQESAYAVRTLTATARAT